MGLFYFLPLRPYVIKSVSLAKFIRILIAYSLFMGAAHFAEMAIDISTEDEERRVCDFSKELQAHFFFQLWLIAMYVSIAIVLILTFAKSRRKLIWADIVNVMFIIQWFASLILLLEFIIVKTNNKTWKWRKCGILNLLYLTSFCVAFALNPCIIFFVNSFGNLPYLASWW